MSNEYQVSLEQQIIFSWQKSGFRVPNIVLIYYYNEYMAVINDTSNLIRFMSTDGQVFMALRSKCQYARPSSEYIGTITYVCSKAHPILCGPSTSSNNREDTFVLDQIIPLL